MADVADVTEAGDVDYVLPTRDDPLLASGAACVGGVAGRRARLRPRASVAVLLALVVLTFGLGLLAKSPCRSAGWVGTRLYPDMCYSDLPLLYDTRGFGAGRSVYASTPAGQALEYPVLTGGLVGLAAWATHHLEAANTGWLASSRRFYDLTAVALAACAAITALCLARAGGRRPYDAALFAAAPALALTATVNWDLLAVALVAGFVLAWSRRAQRAAGVLLGLAVAAKFYPLMLLVPLAALCWRAGRLRALAQTLVWAVGVWLVVNVPVALAWWHGWSLFYLQSEKRGASFGSVWYALNTSGGAVIPHYNSVVTASLLVGLVGLAAVIVGAPRRPRLGAMLFLAVVWFVVTNKVYSPQYVLWLVGLFPLALPRWRPFLVWQAAEAFYFAVVWWYLQGLVNPGLSAAPQWLHTLATVVRIAAQLSLVVLVLRDVWRPQGDVLRAGGADDPVGGVLDGAPDVRGWPWVRGPRPVPVGAPANP